MTETNKLLKSEVESDQASLDYRKSAYSSLANPCPVCHTLMQYVQSKEFEGWRCNNCAKDTPLGKAAEKPVEPVVDTDAVRSKIRRFSDRRSGSC